MTSNYKYILSFLLTILFLIMSQASCANTVHIHNEQDFNKHILQNNGPVVIKFSANWCGACNYVQEPFEQVTQEQEFNNITFAHVDIDELDALSKQHSIVGVPTFVYMQNGKKQYQDIGVKDMKNSKDSLRSTIRSTFKVVQNSDNIVAPESPQSTKNVTPDEHPIEQPASQPWYYWPVRIVQKILELIKTLVDKIINLF